MGNPSLTTDMLIQFGHHFFVASSRDSSDNLLSFGDVAIFIIGVMIAITLLILVFFWFFGGQRSISVTTESTRVDPGALLGSSDNFQITDTRGLIHKIKVNSNSPLVSAKKEARKKVNVDYEMRNLISVYLLSSGVWLIIGSFVGLFLGVKFISPDIDHASWLSFGRLRPVHTNIVFWGWASLALIGLGYFVVSRTSNTRIHSIKIGWYAWVFINASVLFGSISLMAGINNGGGEYREFIWPFALLLALGIFLTAHNFYQTVKHRVTEEIYISNWYILAACYWTIILFIIGYVPFYQSGLGETIVQGYYMHQAVGMWFMTFSLGLMYYFLPSALNKPIYSYSLGVLAFWAQMLFYTMIGTHHFVFSPLPLWLQNIAIVFSAGMFIPVIAGTTNFLMTMKGSGKSISDSYTLPFLLVGVLFYFFGSVQGSLQALRFTNDMWHFTDFGIAHSHITMYGIISFMLWGMIYTLIPKLSYKEPRQILVGVHFWFALIGLIFYSISLMIGGTLKGLSWIEGAPFIESVKLMMPYWIWRAIGGTMMFMSHVVFLFNLFGMTRTAKPSVPNNPNNALQVSATLEEV